MTTLRIVETDEQEEETRPGKMLEVYWRKMYDALAAESTPQTIRSLRSQLRTIKRLAQEPGDDPQAALKSILIHAGIGLEIDR